MLCPCFFSFLEQYLRKGSFVSSCSKAALLTYNKPQTGLAAPVRNVYKKAEH